MKEDKNVLVNPEDVKKLRQVREQREEKKIESDEIKKDFEEVKFVKKGNLVEINLESEGRFSLPDTVYFEDFDVDDVQELSVLDIDDILEALISILDKNKDKSCTTSIGEATPAEFMEILLGIRIKFNSREINHPWICECQQGKYHDDQIVNETRINLTTLKFKSISEADIDFRNKFKEMFEEMADENFIEYLKKRYANNPLENYNKWSIKDELDNIKIKEPIIYISDITNKTYKFNLLRMKNIVQAQKLVNKKYRPKLKEIQAKQDQNMPLAELKSWKEIERKKVEEQKTKDILTYSQALTLTSVNEKDITSDEKKVEEYKLLKRSEYFDINNYISDIAYGIQDERELSCQVCGKTERRLLQREINPLEILPLDTTPQSEQGRDRKLNIYFGI